MQNLNRNKHQNLNNLFYDIGGRVSKYDDRLQQIVPAANQLETIRRHRALTQLVRLSPVPLESPNAAVLLCCLHQKARIVPESCACCALSLSFGALTLTLSAALTAPPAISNYLIALAAVADAGAVNVRLSYSALRNLLPGGGTQRVSCEAPQLTPNIQS